MLSKTLIFGRAECDCICDFVLFILISVKLHAHVV